MASLADLFVATIRALLQPRRLLPITLVAVPMVLAQGRFSQSRWAELLALIVVGLFLLLGPFSWRALFPTDRPIRHRWARVLAFAALGGIPPGVGFILVNVLQMGETLLTRSVNNFVGAALFVVGGWGLGRDIQMEAGLARERARAEGLEREAERAQLLAMRAHLDPHFLFNTLNAIAEWCQEDAAVAERAILQLSALLRQVMAGVKAASWPLEDELDVARKLLDLHQVRDPTRFTVEWSCEAPAGVLVPPLVLLPLFENAMKHGPAAGFDGAVTIVIDAQDGKLHVEICNPGAFGGRREDGEGLAMIEKRLALAYDGAASFDIVADGDRTRATVVVPTVPTGGSA